MFTAFSTALSALTAHATAIDVTGNNLANLNTNGFKASALVFHDLVSQALDGGAGKTQVGFGVGRPVTLRQFAQGAIQSSSGPLDAAIQGDGFFIVVTPAGSTQFTRGGNFLVNVQGQLTTSTDDVLQGWTVGANGVVDTNAPLSPINVPIGTLKPPVATTFIASDLNLNAAATAGPPPDQFATSIQVFDSLGNSHIVTFNFTKNATANTWDYSLSFPDSDVVAPFPPVTGTLTFDSSGRLTVPGPNDPPPTMTVVGLNDGAADLTIEWRLYNAGVPRLTQFSQASATSALAQDGSAPANLLQVGLGDGGKVLANYSNGQQTVVGQLALASVRNPESLLAVGNNNFTLSARSAVPAVGVPNTGGRGQILGGSVEASTVDIAREFTNLIIYQRGYQANTRVITVVDQISQDTINLKQ